MGSYDHRRPLIIDPVLSYSTYLGNAALIADQGSGIAVDSAGNAYVTGGTSSASFPVTPGAFQTTFAGDTASPDVFVTKLNATGSALIYSTYLGGNGQGNGIAVDGSGNAYVTGYTMSSNFPTTPGAFQTALRGSQNAFVTKLNPTGSALVYSTYLGGSHEDQAVGTTSAAQTVTFTNSGTARLAITSVVPSGDFAETNTCGS